MREKERQREKGLGGWVGGWVYLDELRPSWRAPAKHGLDDAPEILLPVLGGDNAVVLGGWVGGWVGGWTGWVDEKEAVRMSDCGLGVGGWDVRGEQEGDDGPVGDHVVDEFDGAAEETLEGVVGGVGEGGAF